MGSTLRVNSILEPCGDGSPIDCPHRVLWVDEETAEVVLFRLEEPLGMPFFVKRPSVDSWTENGLVSEERSGQKPFVLPSWVQRSEESIPLKHKVIRDARWAIVEPLVTGENRVAIFDRERRGQIILERAALTGVKRENFYFPLKLYWRYGQVPNALLPAFEKCTGRGGIRRSPVTTEGELPIKRGRPPEDVAIGHNPKAKGINVNREDRENIGQAIKLFHIHKGFSKVESYRRMNAQWYARSEEIEGQIFRIPFPQEKLIKPGAFYYWASRILNDPVLQSEVVGDEFWTKNYRNNPGRARDTTRGPTDIYEIDATVGNMYLVSRYNRNRLIGRPVKYKVVDRASTCIVGYHLALEGPSWNTARMALFCAFTNKKKYLERYGITIRPEDWPCEESCSLLVSDNAAELLGISAETSLRNMLHMDAEFNAVGKPERKGTVESSHQMDDQISWIPGAWKARAQERATRKGPDPRNDACLTINELVEIDILEILHHNNNKRVTNLLTPEMVQAGVKPYRRDIYLWGLRNRIGEAPRQNDPGQLYRCLLPTRRMSFTDDGMKFNGLLYIPVNGDYKYIRTKANLKQSQYIGHYDPNNTNIVLHFNEETDTWDHWKLTENCWENYANNRVEDVLEMLAWNKQDAREAADEETRNREVKRQKQEIIVGKATKEKNETPVSAGKKEKQSAIKSNRVAERELDRGIHRQAHYPEIVCPSRKSSSGLSSWADTSHSRRNNVIALRAAKSHKTDVEDIDD